MKKLLCSIVALSTFIVSAQQQLIPFNKNNAREGESVEYCRQHTMQEHALATDAQFRSEFVVAQDNMERAARTMGAEKSGTVYTIPVVFHILHTNGVENISDEQVFDAVAVLNRDFRKLNADANTVKSDFLGLVADAEIQFRLATKAPNGTCFNGITRTVSSLTDGGSGQQQLYTAMNNNNVYQGTWDHTKYLNIIVAKNIGGAAGYTFLPGSSQAYYNTIFILQEYVGRIGSGTEYRSRSLTHEVGHWLNLKHTWGDGNEPGSQSNCNMDDGVADTPNTRGVQSCNLNENACGPLANVENYMDYSYCSKMFTTGQVNRMRSAITSSSRSNLWSASNLALVGADGVLSLCKADFEADKRVVCVGTTVRFVDRSFNTVTGRTWNFPGGTPSSTTAATVDVTYNTPGVYAVTLTATAGAATETETKTQYITVLANSGLPFYEGFEGYTTLNDANGRWEVVNSGGTNQFEVTTEAAKTGQKSVRLRNYADRGTSNLDELISQPFDLTGQQLDDVVLSFRYAFRRTNTTNTDKLVIYMSRDCGDSWDIRRTLTSPTMSSAVVSNNWVPSSSDFVTFHMPFNTSYFTNYFGEGFRFKFSFFGGTGNNFFLDDINLYNGSQSDEPVMAIDNVDGLTGVNIFPNPAQEELNVVYDLPGADVVNVVVMDVTGKVLSSTTVQSNAGTNVVVLDNTNLSAGSYLVNVVTSTSKKTMQFVKM